MARITHAAQIDLRFGNPARQLQNFGFGVWPGDFARERVHLFGKNGIGKNRHAQPVAKRISRRAGAALSGFRAGAGPCVGAVCLDLARARHAGSFPSDLPQRLETAGLESVGVRSVRYAIRGEPAPGFVLPRARSQLPRIRLPPFRARSAAALRRAPSRRRSISRRLMLRRASAVLIKRSIRSI